MTEAQARKKAVEVMLGWIGLKESDGSHRKIIDIYNKQEKLPANYKVKYTDAWCATTVSAAAIVAALSELYPLECSCSRMIEKAKKMVIWQEDDAYIPSPADLVLYDWDDGVNYAKTDNKGNPEHVGMVVAVTATTITVVEGNKSNAVGTRNLPINGRYIRGFVTPNFSAIATEKDVPNTSGQLKVGDTVNFIGKVHYSSSYAGANGTACKSGKATITAINKGKKHPYHLIYIAKGGSTVYGWVDETDIEGISKPQTISVGDAVVYSGTVHYTSSYAGAKKSACKGGKAKVTAINKNGAHPYHLVKTEKGCTVHGWVNADQVTK